MLKVGVVTAYYGTPRVNIHYCSLLGSSRPAVKLLL